MAAVMWMLKRSCFSDRVLVKSLFWYLLAGHDNFWGFDTDLWHFEELLFVCLTESKVMNTLARYLCGPLRRLDRWPTSRVIATNRKKI